MFEASNVMQYQKVRTAGLKISALCMTHGFCLCFLCAMCSHVNCHTKQKHKHMARKTNHQPCAKQDTNTDNENPHKLRVHTKHESTRPREPKAACNNTRQRENTLPNTNHARAAQNTTTQEDRRVYGPNKLETARSHNKTEHGA